MFPYQVKHHNQPEQKWKETMGKPEVAETEFRPLKIKRRNRSIDVGLKLTSMIDMFTILLVFLLKNYSAEGHILSVAPDLRLPESTAQKFPQVTSIIAISQEWILLDGKRVVPVAQVLDKNTLMIPELLNELNRLKGMSEKMGEINKAMGFTGNISLQGDKELPYQIIKKVMFTCGQMGYNDIVLNVTRPD